jgi:hypothetical protein
MSGKGNVLTGSDTVEIAEKIFISTGENMLAVIRNIINRRLGNRYRTSTQRSPTFQQRDLMPGF